jgi:hypothetical protein
MGDDGHARADGLLRGGSSGAHPSAFPASETVLAITGLASLPEVSSEGGSATGAKANGEVLLEVARSQWSIENGNHYVRDRSYDEDRCPVREPNSAQILATLRSLARFLARQQAHRPRTPHQTTTFCDAHRHQTIHWLMSPRGFR